MKDHKMHHEGRHQNHYPHPSEHHKHEHHMHDVHHESHDGLMEVSLHGRRTRMMPKLCKLNREGY